MEERDVVQLVCPLCEKEGKTEPVKTLTTHVWVPALYPRWVPRWAQERGFLSLEEAVRKAPAFSALIKERKGRKEAEQVCNAHGRLLRDAKIWTSQLSWVLQKQAEAGQARAEKAFGSLASFLGGEAVAEIKSAVEAEETKTKKPQRGSKGRKTQGEERETGPKKRTRDTRAKAKCQTEEEVQEAIEEAASEGTS